MVVNPPAKQIFLVSPARIFASVPFIYKERIGRASQYNQQEKGKQQLFAESPFPLKTNNFAFPTFI
jgi:hypothetical protein